MDNRERCVIAGVAYVESREPDPIPGRLTHTCYGCAACDGSRVNHKLCGELPACCSGAAPVKRVVWVRDEEADADASLSDQERSAKEVRP